MNLHRTKLLLTLLVAMLLLFGGPDPFTQKHLLIFFTALLVIFGTPVVKALLVRLRLMLRTHLPTGPAARRRCVDQVACCHGARRLRICLPVGAVSMRVDLSGFSWPLGYWR